MRAGKPSYPFTRLAKSGFRLSRCLNYFLLFSTLIVGTLIPFPLWADVPAPPQNSYADGKKLDGTDDPRIIEILEELFGRDKKSDRPDHMPVDLKVANRGYILFQELVLLDEDGNTREHWNLSRLDIGLEKVKPDLERLHTDLGISFIPGGVSFQLKGYQHRHNVYFRDGRSAIHSVESKNAFYFLLDDGTILGTPKDYFHALYSGNISLHVVARVKMQPGLKLHVIHRVNENDNSLIDVKDPTKLEEELYRGRPIPISGEIAEAWEKSHPNQPFPYTEGDLATVLEREGREEIVDIISRISITDQLDLHTNVDFLLMALLSPDRILFQKEFSKVRTQGREAVLNLAKDDAKVQALLKSNLADALSRVSEDSIEQGRSQTEQMLRLQAQEDKEGNGGRLRDRFSYEDLVASHLGIKEARAQKIAGEKINQEQSGLRTLWSNTVGGISKGIERLDLVQNMKRVALVLGKAAGVVGLAVGVDQIWLDGAYTHLAIETVTNLMGIAQNSLPIMKANPNYLWWDLPWAVGTLLMMFGALLATASALARWGDEKLDQAAFCVRHGIRLFSQLLPGLSTLTKITGRKEAYRSMQEGYLKMLMPAGDSLQKQAQIDEANKDIRTDQRLQQLATMIALAAAGVNHDVDPGAVAAAAGGHDLNTDEGLQAAMETSQLIYFELTQTSQEELDSLFSENYDLFAEAYQKWVKRAQAMRDPCQMPGVAQKWNAWARSTASIRLIKSFSSWGDDLKDKLEDAKPNDIISRLTHRTTVISFLLTTLVTAVAGGFANPAEVDKLFAQPGAFLGINPMVLVNSMETLVFSMTVAAATTFLAFFQRRTPILDSYRPQIEHLVSDKPHTRTVLREYWELLRNLFDVRNSQPLRFAALTNYLKRVVFFLPCLVLGVLPRVIGAATEGNFEKGLWKTLVDMPVQGELTAWALAMTFYAFVFCFMIPAQERLEVDIKNLRIRYEFAIAGLDQALRLKDGSLRPSVNSMLKLYSEEGRSTDGIMPAQYRRGNPILNSQRLLDFSRRHPPIADSYEAIEEAWHALENVESTDGEVRARVRARNAINAMRALYRKHGGLPGKGIVTTEEQFARRLLEFAGEQAPVPTEHREDLARVNMIGVGAASAYLASFLYPHTYVDRGWTAFNWTDWNLWFNDPGDGVPGLLLKMLVYTYAFIAGQNVVNTFLDSWVHRPWYDFKTKILGYERDLRQEMELEKRSKESSEALQSILGLNLIKKLAHNVWELGDASIKGLNESLSKCVIWLGQAAQNATRKKPPQGPK